MDRNTVIGLAAEAGFGANQRNTLLVKLLRFAELVEARSDGGTLGETRNGANPRHDCGEDGQNGEP